jgi:hypothetical protein
MLDINGMCFLFDGIRMCATHTPAELNMKVDEKEEKSSGGIHPFQGFML